MCITFQKKKKKKKKKSHLDLYSADLNRDDEFRRAKRYRRVGPKMFEKKDNLSVQLNPTRSTDLTDHMVWMTQMLDFNYSHQPVGKDKLGKMMNLMADKGGLIGRKVNHSTRKTFAMPLVQAGHPPTEVVHSGGWKNIQTINEYSVPSVIQQEDASNIISNILVPTDQSAMSNYDHAQREMETIPESNNYSIKKSQSHLQQTPAAENPMTFFAGASISDGNITINLISSKKS